MGHPEGEDGEGRAHPVRDPISDGLDVTMIDPEAAGFAGPRFERSLRLVERIDRAAHLLPAQGPITVFIHHNTLHAFEALPFHEAVKKGSEVFGCQPYLTEDRYREELARGRIVFEGLQEALEQDLGAAGAEPIPPFGTRSDLRLAMLQYPIRTGPTEELIWHVAEANALHRVRDEVAAPVRARLIAETRRWVTRDLRDPADPEGDPDRPADRRTREVLRGLLGRYGDQAIEDWSDADWEAFTLQALWRVCREGVRDLPPSSPAPAAPIRHRDLLLKATGDDADVPVHAVLTAFCAAFLDQGFASWELPGRDAGFYRSFRALYGTRLGPPDRAFRGLADELARLEARAIGPLESALESIEILGVPESEWEDYLSATFLALRGWGGMVREVERRGDRAVRPIPAGSLVEFLAVRLILDRFALAALAYDAIGYDGPLSGLRAELRGRSDSDGPPSVEQRAFPVFQLAQAVGLSPGRLWRLDGREWARMVGEIEAFTAIDRRRVFHIAYEQRFVTQALDALAIRARRRPGRTLDPRFQVVCCIDDREESFRRHVEELEPRAETFGVAGFYNVAMYYRGAADAHFTPLCPVVIRPSHWVTEEVAVGLGRVDRRRAMTRRVIGAASHRFHVGSRSFAMGAVLTGAVGVLASFPLVGRILFPRLAARVRKLVGRIVETPPATRLQLERTEETPGPDSGHVGFSLDEMAASGERMLRDIGLTSGFAPLVVLLGHGSNSQNNPHNSAYMCGACGGGAGGPNARAMAQVLNDRRVRGRLAGRGLAIPDSTSFVGGYHNTCDDTVIVYDLDDLPTAGREAYRPIRAILDAACARNAHERCRRFLSAPLTLSFEAAREHVDARSEDLAQTRPELGHATNAITFVGRRDATRGLFLDRRSFLTSYDPTLDDDQDGILTRILQAVVPVCSGINLEYYFSRVDNVGYGAGTKLPHNLSALLGVVDGAASDLRTGLPWQMVEIHEPVRSLFVIETTPGAMARIIERNSGIGETCRNGWVLLAVLDPESGAISIYEDGAFRPYVPRVSVLPRAASSADWYRGWRDHLEFAAIDPEPVRVGAGGADR